MSVTWW